MSAVTLGRARRDEQMVTAGCRSCGGRFRPHVWRLHLYNNHLEQAREQLSRECRSLPRMKLNPAVKDIQDLTFEDFELVGYNPHPSIKASIAV